IRLVVEEATPDPRDADELHDALLIHGGLPADEVGPFQALFDALIAARRAARLVTPAGVVCVPAERSHEWRALHPEARLEPEVERPLRAGESSVLPEREVALRELARGRLEMSGPITSAE